MMIREIKARAEIGSQLWGVGAPARQGATTKDRQRRLEEEQCRPCGMDRRHKMGSYFARVLSWSFDIFSTATKPERPALRHPLFFSAHPTSSRVPQKKSGLLAATRPGLRLVTIKCRNSSLRHKIKLNNRIGTGFYIASLLLGIGYSVGCNRHVADDARRSDNDKKSAIESSTPASDDNAPDKEKLNAGRGATAVDAGVLPRKKMVFGAFEINPDEPCDHCEERFCTRINGKNYVEECAKGKGAKECEALVACAARTGCAKSEVARCYCGAGMEISDCMAKGGAGACQAEVEAAAQTKNSREIAVRFANAKFPVGRAFALITCKKNYCPKCNE